VASNRASGQFLIVAAVVGASGFQRIRGQLYENLSTPQSPFWGPASLTLDISPDGFDAVNPDVGGDASTATPGYYCVTWERIFTTSDHDILVQMVRTNGTLFGSTIYLSNSGGTIDGTPSIASTNGKSRSLIQNWTIAWARVAGFLTSDLYAGRVRWDGVVSNTPFAIDTSSSNTRAVSVSSPTDDLSPFTLIAYTRGNSSSAKTWGYVYEGSLFKDHANLTALTGADPSESHVYPNVDCDGRAFVLVDTETWLGTTLYATYVSTLSWFANALRPNEAQTVISGPSSTAPQARVACQGASGGPARRSLATFSYGDDDLRGTYYDAGSFTSFCHAGQDNVPACPCGNAPSQVGRGCDNSSQTGGGRLRATGAVDPDTVKLIASDLKPSTVCIFAQAHLLSTTGVALGDGLQCVAGSVRRLAAKTAMGGVAVFPDLDDPSISARSAALGDTILPGTERSYHVFYRDQNPTWACTAPSNVTNALRVDW
jgi:hypothetical protein